MGKLLRQMKVRPDWAGEVHDANCRYEDVVFDSAAGALIIRCWRPFERPLRRDSLWEELLIVFEGLTARPAINRAETLPYYELSTVYFDPRAKRVHICFHVGLSIEYPATEPRFSYRGATGQRRQHREVFP